MYPYHNKIKQRIELGELTAFEFVPKYKTISPCLLLYFKTHPFIKPIREHRFEMYKELLKDLKHLEKNKMELTLKQKKLGLDSK